MNLFLKTFRLVGLEKHYEFNFKKGLNFISGPTSTGKTTIFELIDYALGSKSHKSYIEVGEKCTAVELEIVLVDTLYRIKRTLFDFNLPVLVEIFDNNNQKFLTYGVFNTDSQADEKSLSTFLLSKLNLNGVKIANQNFSFRDLFKFSYLKQTAIDNEDILSQSNWPIYNKQKATFEIIYNFYDKLRGEIKAELIKKQDELRDEKTRYEGVTQFLKTSDVESFESVKEKEMEFNNKIDELNMLLRSKKKHVDQETSDSRVNKLNKSVLNKKNLRKNFLSELRDQEQYIGKLNTLHNQYESDIEKIEATIMGVREINKYDFQLCPNCLRPISSHLNENNCLLCGSTMEVIVENTLMLKREITNTRKKMNELEKHVLHEISKRNQIHNTIKRLSEEIKNEDNTLEELTKQYINPFVEEISLINMELGKSYTKLDELKDSLRFIKEMNRLSILLVDKQKEVDSLKEQIKEQSNLNDKTTIINSLSSIFSDILEGFKFPKLENAHISSNDYLPHVRGRKYNDLGSLGAVTLITMAYYLSILVESTNISSNHLNLLMIDTPGKNLGVSSESTEFQDEDIFNSIIKYFMNLDKNLSEKIQLIVINNGYPDFLPRESIILEFSSDGQTGLIDDI